MSVREAAERLGVSPGRVRQLIDAGSLAADRVGERWVVGDVSLVLAGERRVGRPWSSGAAWGALWLAFGRPAPWLSPRERSRVRARLRGGLEGLVVQLSRRADRLEFVAHPSALGRLVADRRAVLGGWSAAPAVGADLIGGEGVELYVLRADLDDVVAGFGLVAAGGSVPNVVLHVVDWWPFDAEERVAPPVVVALDLLEHRDDRSRRAGGELLAAAIRSVEGPWAPTK